MKSLLSILLICSFSIAAESPKQEVKLQQPRYRHIQDADGKILATIDNKDGSIEYKESPKKSVEQLIKLVDNVIIQCQKEISEASKRPEPKKK